MRAAWHKIEGGRDKLAPWLLSLFLGLGPVYWLPGISMEALQRFDWAILLLSVALVLGTEALRGRRPFPPGLLGPLGFAGILLLWIPGLVQASEPFRVFVFVFEFSLACVFFWCFYCIARAGGDIRTIFQRAFIIIVILGGAALFRALLNTPDWQSPCQWDRVYTIGFAIIRRSTVWSIGLGLFIPVGAFFFLASSRRWRLDPKFFGIMGIAVLLGAQFVSGGRAGIMSSMLVLGALLLLPAFRRLAAMVILIGLAVSIPFLDESCLAHLRLDEWTVPDRAADHWSLNAPARYAENVPGLVKELDFVSARRIQGYLLGLEKVAERPLLGHGLEQVRLKVPGSDRLTEIHNLWLKWAVYTGIAAPLLLLFMVALILRTGWRLFGDRSRGAVERNEAAALLLILLSGLLISMFEVNTLMGAFQRTAIWWAAAGALVGSSAKSSSRDARHPQRLQPPAAE